MPTIDELQQLYNSGAYGSVINRTNYYVWSSETRDSDAAHFRFNTGHRVWCHQGYYGNLRALPVRSGN
jgi:hypothetical protein